MQKRHNLKQNHAVLKIVWIRLTASLLIKILDFQRH